MNMLNKTKKLTKILIVSGLILSAPASFAQQIPFPDPQYTTTEMINEGCDPNVYNQMYTQARNRYNSQATSMTKLFVKDQLEASPKDVTNKMLSCVDNAIRTLDGVVSSIMGIYNMITGAGNFDWGALGAKAVNAISNYACNAVNSYTSNLAYSATQPYNAVMTSIPSTITNTIGSINTPVGNINIGQMATDQLTSGTQQSSTVVRDAVTGAVTGAVTTATSTTSTGTVAGAIK